MPLSANWKVGKAAVLGAGAMGSRIAAHLANCGIPTCLLDLSPTQLTLEEERKKLDLKSPQVRNRIARQGLEAALKSRPAAFFTEENSGLITVGNFEDHLSWVSDADWIIEAVAEDLEIKRILWQRVAPLRKPGSVASTNSSGLSIAEIAAGLPEEFRRHWLGTHFFNPPRYLHLLELIPGPDTLAEVLEAVTRFADLRLGKGVVVAKDTPNFIANRTGVFCTSLALRLAQQEGLTVEETDRQLNAVAGWPRSALFGTLDLVGLDIFAAAARTVYDRAPHDERRELFLLPEIITRMMARGLLGNKSGSGFYKRPPKSSGGEPLVLDLETFEYRPAKQGAFASLESASHAADTAMRWQLVLQSDDRASRFLWKFLSQTFLYAARRIPEIAQSVVDIDRAMRWGYGWELGPFELWDAVGVEETARRMESDGNAIPENVAAMLHSGHRHFYDSPTGSLRYFDFSRAAYSLASFSPGVLLLRGGPQTPPVLRRNEGASLRDLGDGVLGVEFHSKMNVLGMDAVEMAEAGLAEGASNFDALVIGNQGAHFSAGANLLHLLTLIRAGNWDELDRLVRRFQQMHQSIKYSSMPVVVSPFGQTLGGGCEISLAAPRVQAAAETYIGLVETGVGLVPAGGGIKEMLVRLSDSHPRSEELAPATRELFRTISLARVSSCAEDARQLGFLRDTDGITINPDRLLMDAKQTALELIRHAYRPAHPVPRHDIRVLGEGGLAVFRIGVHVARQGQFITEYDAVVLGKLAHVVCGGKLTGPATVSEQYLLDLGREAFLSLCGEAKTQERIQHTLATGKPLRN
ncbi:MAG: enoyl-CoA hydratase/isomerase family protein [Acidobacteria bacterium]|nr:enoyl-CoA hydratase/isomerase family protein [Acidobacteriota bacterium]